MLITFSELNERDETVYECPSEESLHLWYRYLVLNWIQMNHRWKEFNSFMAHKSRQRVKRSFERSRFSGVTFTLPLHVLPPLNNPRFALVWPRQRQRQRTIKSGGRGFDSCRGRCHLFCLVWSPSSLEVLRMLSRKLKGSLILSDPSFAACTRPSSIFRSETPSRRMNNRWLKRVTVLVDNLMARWFVWKTTILRSRW